MQLLGVLPVLLALQVILPLPRAFQPHPTPRTEQGRFSCLWWACSASTDYEHRWWACCRLLRGRHRHLLWVCFFRRLLWGRHGSSRMSGLCGLAINFNEPVHENKCQPNAVMKHMLINGSSKTSVTHVGPTVGLPPPQWKTRADVHTRHVSQAHIQTQHA